MGTIWDRRTFLAGAASLIAAGSARGQSAGQRPNLILIVADDIGFSDIAPFGSEIATPHLSALAAHGRLLTNFHTPPAGMGRAELIAGIDHHLAGMAATYNPLGRQVGKTAYQRHLADNALSVAELLRDSGYHTYMSGRWGVGTEPKDGPSARGFERSYAVMGLANDFFKPTRGDPAKSPWVYLDEGERVSQPDGFNPDLFTEKLISYIEKNRGDGKPFFAFNALPVPHFPLQAPDSYLAKYRGRYDAGYDPIRLARIARQKSLGVIPNDFRPANPVPTPRIGSPVELLTWKALREDEKAYEARRMEVYAACVENMDAQVGRFLDYLKSIGAYDNSFIVFCGANGPSTDMPMHKPPEDIDNNLENMGRRDSFLYFSARWAEVCAAPFSHWKGKGYEGALSTPGIVKMPGRARKGPNIDAFLRLRDLPPTFLAMAGIGDPGAKYRGRDVIPMTGVSALPVLRGNAASIHPRDAIFAGESSGEGYLRRGKWKLVRVTPYTVNYNETADSVQVPRIEMSKIGGQSWALFDIENDRGETTDLAARHPEIVKDLVGAYEAFAASVGVAEP